VEALRSDADGVFLPEYISEFPRTTQNDLEDVITAEYRDFRDQYSDSEQDDMGIVSTRTHTAWRLAHVCQSWRTVAFSFPEMWALINLDITGLETGKLCADEDWYGWIYRGWSDDQIIPTEALPLLNALCKELMLSSRTPLRVHIACPKHAWAYDPPHPPADLHIPPDTVLSPAFYAVSSFFDVLASHSWRWKELTIYIPHDMFAALDLKQKLLSAGDSGIPKLQAMNIVFLESDKAESQSATFPIAPLLREMTHQEKVFIP
jgi:hypothetical protein